MRSPSPPGETSGAEKDRRCPPARFFPGELRASIGPIWIPAYAGMTGGEDDARGETTTRQAVCMTLEIPFDERLRDKDFYSNGPGMEPA